MWGGISLVRKYLIILLSFFLICTIVSADEILNLKIFYVEHKLPEVNIYFNLYDQNGRAILKEMNRDDFEVFINDVIYESDSLTLAKDDHRPIQTLFLVDISTSMSNHQMSNVRDFMLKWNDEKSDKDEIGILTFGDEINLIQEFTTNEIEISNSIHNIDRTDDTTAFYDGIHQGITLLNQSAINHSGRQMMIVFSDAEDVDAGGTTYTELMSMVQKSNSPIYGIGTVINPDQGDQINLDSFAEIARTSGGHFYKEREEDYFSIYNEIKNLLDYQYNLKLEMNTNAIDYEEKNLKLVINHSGYRMIAEHNYINNLSQMDIEAPEIEEYQLDIENHDVTINFNEKVSLTKENIYLINDSQDKLELMSITPINEKSYLLLLPEGLKGQVTLVFDNVTDLSMEKNLLVNASLTFEFPIVQQNEDVQKEDVPEEIESLDVKEEQIFNIKIVLIGFGGILFITLLSILIFKKRNVLMISVDYTVGNRKSKRYALNIMKSSLLVGRSKECNLAIDDEELSRQHFSIYFKNGVIYLEDLNSSNGTFMNGQRLNQKVELLEENILNAGNTKFDVKIIMK